MRNVTAPVRTLTFGFAALLVFALAVSMSAAPASANVPSVDEVKSDLTSQSTIAEVADRLGVEPETVANSLTDELGTQTASEVATYVKTNEIDVQANIANVERYSSRDGGPPGSFNTYKTCPKSIAAASLFGIWGTAICSAAAASSVGALGVPCELILTIGSASLDWGKVCD